MTDGKLETGDKIEFDFARGGTRAGIKINGSEELPPIQAFELKCNAGDLSVLTIHFGMRSVPSQRGYFVAEADMAAFAAYQVARRMRKVGANETIIRLQATLARLKQYAEDPADTQNILRLEYAQQDIEHLLGQCCGEAEAGQRE